MNLELVHLFDRLRDIKAFIFDVDGVLTDNRILVTEEGDFLRTMNVKDGQAIKWVLEAGFPVGIITGSRSVGVEKRMRLLGIEHIYTGRSDKMPAFNDFLQIYSLKPSEILYIGDDIPDMPVMKRVGLAVAPADAANEILEIADYISPFKGGDGCVRDMIEKVLKLQQIKYY